MELNEQGLDIPAHCKHPIQCKAAAACVGSCWLLRKQCSKDAECLHEDGHKGECYTDEYE